MIHRAARANHIGLVVLWMNACFHLSKGAQILRVFARKRKQ
jgi:hypothetical protein